MNHLFAELKRRNVIRVGLSYAVVSWVIIQAADTLEDVLFLPEWFTTAIVAVLVLGFPVALIISWAYELTPEGLLPTAEVDASNSVTHETAKRLDLVTIGVVCVAIALMFLRPYITPSQSDIAKNEEADIAAMPNSRVGELIAESTIEEDQVDEASIAVLPFVNLSSDPEQEYFSDGISEELLNLFAKIPELRVAARTSSFQFKDQNMDISEIGSQLNVAHVLEGSVRKSGTKLRITAQLIKADSGFHLWSETYDRELEDIFAIQDEISIAIVESLGELLGIDSQTETPTAIRTDSTAAYEAYLQGKLLASRQTDADLQAAQIQFERAIEFDPSFAPAYADLAGTYLLRLGSFSTYGDLTLAFVEEKALPLIERALELAPTLPAAHRRKAQLLSMQSRYDESIRAARIALDFGPNEPGVYTTLALNYQASLNYSGLLDALEKSYEIDPINPTTMSNLAIVYTQNGRLEEAEILYQKMEVIDPRRASPGYAIIAAERGQPVEAMNHHLNGVEQFPDYDRPFRLLALYLSQAGFYEEAVELFPVLDAFIYYSAGQTQLALDTITQKLDTDPNNNFYKIQYADILAQAGDYEDAVALYKEIDASTNGKLLGEDFGSSALNLVTLSLALGDNETAEEITERMQAAAEAQEQAGKNWSNGFVSQFQAHLVAGDRDLAFAKLKQAVARGAIIARGIVLNTVPALSEYIDDPRLIEVFELSQESLDQSMTVFFDRVCAQPPMEFWQPSTETCERAAAMYDLDLASL